MASISVLLDLWCNASQVIRTVGLLEFVFIVSLFDRVTYLHIQTGLRKYVT